MMVLIQEERQGMTISLGLLQRQVGSLGKNIGDGLICRDICLGCYLSKFLPQLRDQKWREC
jgi:hypothetical protein